MSRLVGVDLRRLWTRRLVRRSVVALFLGVVLAPALVPWAFSEQARIKHDADLERCVQDQPPKVRDGVTMPTIPSAVAEPAERRRRCDEVTPELDPDFHLRQLDQVFRTTAAFLIIGGFVIGASSIGADWQAGVVPTILTWEGRRARVFGSRLLALVAGTFAVIVLWEALVGLSLVPQALMEDTADGMGGAALRTIGGLGLRVAVIGAGSALLGFALAMVGRGTAAALGVGFAYLFVFENVVGSQFRPLRPWLLLWNALVFVKGTFEAGGDVPDRTVTAAGLLLLVWAAAVITAAAAVFVRRDVA
jgi:ABC-2 type transport system permease protein